jgi:hypothetical protein
MNAVMRKVIIFSVFFFYAITPIVDGIVCEDCINPVFQLKWLENNYLNITADASSISDTYDDKSSPQKDIKSFCAVCVNAAKMLNTHNADAISSSVALAFQSESLTMLEPTFSINKPPQN